MESFRMQMRRKRGEQIREGLKDPEFGVVKSKHNPDGKGFVEVVDDGIRQDAVLELVGIDAEIAAAASQD